MQEQPGRQDDRRAKILHACNRISASLDVVDAAVVMGIVRSPESPTDRQVFAIWRLLRKYVPQLAAAGIDYPALVAPEIRAGVPQEVRETPSSEIRISFVQTTRGRRLRLTFPNDPRMTEALKRIRKSASAPPWFDESAKAWVIPEDFELMDRVALALKDVDQAISLQIDEDVRRLAENVRQETQRIYDASRAETSEIEVPTKLPLRPFQKAAVQWIEDRGGRALIADEMGLGKTVAALGFLAKHPEALPALVIASATLKPNWVKEFHRFTDYRANILSSKSSLKAFKNLGYAASLVPEAGYDALVMNYDLFEAETPRAWARKLAAGDESCNGFLLAAGEYAIKPLNQVYSAATDIGIKQKILDVIRQIGMQGAKANRKKFVKVTVNGMALEKFLEFGFRTIICDESHNLKEPKAQRTMAVHAIAPTMQNVLLLTGTPILNRVRDVWSQVYAINPTIWPSFVPFGVRYCDGKKEEVRMKGSKGKGKETMQEVWNFMGASNLEELDRKLRTLVMIRRLKKDVLKELPDKIQVTIPIVAEKGMEAYKKESKPILKKLVEIRRERDEWKARLAGMPGDERRAYLAEHAAEAAEKSALAGVAIKAIDALKVAAMKLKFQDAMKFILDAHEQSGKLVLYMSHYETIDRIMESLARADVKAEAIDGRVAGPDREPIKERFQTGDTEILVGGIRAAGEGLTLTASHTVIFVEFDWNPAKHQQAADRVHRIGQTMAPTIYYLVAVGTIEEKIVAMIDAKRELSNAVLGETDRTMNEDGILDALLAEVSEQAA